MKSTNYNYLITIQYDGSHFSGFQKQKDKRTIQGEIEKVLTKLNKEEVKVVGAGRTDKGVHALSQMVNFKLNRHIKPEKLKYILNQQLDKYIFIKDCIEVNDKFHARFNATNKTYVYMINNGSYNPLLEDYMLQLRKPLNLHKMKKTRKLFIGEKDFENFVSGKRKNYVSNIYKIKIYKKHNIIYIVITGAHFYQYMVRNIVGALIEVGQEKVNNKLINDMLNKKTKKRLTTALPQGLYLKEVKYEEKL